MLFAYMLQVALTAVVVILAWMWHGGEAGRAALLGGLIAAVNVGLLVWRWRKGRWEYHSDVQRHLRQFHRSALERFFVVVILLLVGILVLQVKPEPMLVGFIAGQVAWVIAASVLKTE